LRLGRFAAIFLTGHYGPNWRDLKTLVDLLQPYTAARLYGLPDFEANQPGFDGDGKRGADHAGKVETSLLWALEPDCVDVSRLPEPGAEGPHFAMGRDARESDRRVGERMVEDEAEWLRAKGRALLEAYETDAPSSSRLLTFGDVEAFWRKEVEPVLKDFETMRPESFSELPPESRPPEASSWYPNSKVPESLPCLS